MSEIDMTEGVFIVSGCRTPIGCLQGSLKDVPAHKLGRAVIEEVLKRAKLPAQEVDEVIMGQVLTAGQGQNPARQAAIGANLPAHVPAYSVNMLCGSGLKAVFLGFQSIKNGDAQVIVCGGQESMSQAVHFINLRKAAKLGNAALKDTIIVDGLTDAFLNIHMGLTVENLATKFEVSRFVQDEFALASQLKTVKALKANYFETEIVPIVTPKNVLVTVDEFPKPETTMEALAKLRPVFKPEGGTVTAGNASGINDGAAALVLVSAAAIEKYNLQPLVKIKGFSQVAVDPIDMGIAPVKAIKKLLQVVDWSINEVDLYEINEAFAAQSLLVAKLLDLDFSKVNIVGGSIALGHPIGASGARILVTLIHTMMRTGLSKGVATLCIGGGMAIAIAIQTCD